MAEEDLADEGGSNAGVEKVKEFAREEHSEVFVICAQIEQEISELDEDEKAPPDEAGVGVAAPASRRLRRCWRASWDKRATFENI